MFGVWSRRARIVDVAIVILVITAGAISAEASICVPTVKGFASNPRAVLEGQADFLGFKVTNNSQCDIGSIVIGNPTLRDLLVDFPPDDVVTDAALQFSNCVAGLKKGQSCGFVVEFTTGDDNVGDPSDNDRDHGTFLITTVVNTDRGFPVRAEWTINVYDVPEPSTLLFVLTSTGMIRVLKRNTRRVTLDKGEGIVKQ